MSITNPLIYGAPCFIALIILELSYSQTHRRKDIYVWKDLFSNLTFGVVTAVLASFFKTVAVIVFFNFVYNTFNVEVNGVITNIMGWQSFGYAWYVWLLCQLADDFSYYWFHRANHKIRFFWAAHVVHHSSNSFNLGIGIRNGLVTILYKPLFYVWIVAIGFPPPMLIVCLGIEALWQFQLHTLYIKKLGFLEKIMNTHTMHQVHHAKNIEYLDMNHGGYLNIFDKIFGSWKELDPNIKIKYGVTVPPNSHHPVEIFAHEYRNIWNDMKKSKNWYHKFMYVFAPPGWSHDGSTMTLRQKRKKIELEK